MPDEKETNHPPFVVAGDNETMKVLSELLQNPDNAMQALAKANEIAESLVDIPAQIQLLARCQLAGNFIVTKPDGTKDFKAKAFEATWTI